MKNSVFTKFVTLQELDFERLTLTFYFYGSFVIFCQLYKGKSKIYVVEWFFLNIPQIPIFILEKPFNGIHTMFEVIVWNHFSQCQIVKPEGVLGCRRVDLVSSIECGFWYECDSPSNPWAFTRDFPENATKPFKKNAAYKQYNITCHIRRSGKGMTQ